MARYGDITVQLLRRVRQHGGLPISDDLAVQILSRCEGIINTATRRVLNTVSLTIPKEKALFSMQELPSLIDIESITQANRELLRVDHLSEFSAMELNWFRSTGSRLEAYHQLGRDFLVLYPMIESASSVSVRGTALIEVQTDLTAAANTEMALPDEDLQKVLQLAETVLLFRSRDHQYIESRLKSLMESLNGKN